MFIAGKFTCTFPETEDVQVICESSSPFDWIAFGSMIGTLLAVFASVVTAAIAVRHSNKSMEKSLELERKKRFNDSLFSYSDALIELRKSLPNIEHSRTFALADSVQKMSIDMLTTAEKKLHSSLADLTEKIMSGYRSEWFSTLPIRYMPGSPDHLTRRQPVIQGSSTIYQVIFESSGLVKDSAYLIVATKDQQSELLEVEKFGVECSKLCQRLFDEYLNDDED